MSAPHRLSTPITCSIPPSAFQAAERRASSKSCSTSSRWASDIEDHQQQCAVYEKVSGIRLQPKNTLALNDCRTHGILYFFLILQWERCKSACFTGSKGVTGRGSRACSVGVSEKSPFAWSSSPARTWPKHNSQGMPTAGDSCDCRFHSATHVLACQLRLSVLKTSCTG